MHNMSHTWVNQDSLRPTSRQPTPKLLRQDSRWFIADVKTADADVKTAEAEAFRQDSRRRRFIAFAHSGERYNGAKAVD